MSERSAVVLPFALGNRWIVTVESERQFVKVRHRTRWYAVARRKGMRTAATGAPAGRTQSVSQKLCGKDSGKSTNWSGSPPRITPRTSGSARGFTNGSIPGAASNDGRATIP
jgi:hypothetical protein